MAACSPSGDRGRGDGIASPWSEPAAERRITGPVRDGGMGVSTPSALAVHSVTLSARVKGSPPNDTSRQPTGASMNIAPLGREATLEDLFAVEGNAELVDGRLVLMPPTSDAHNRT